MQISEFSKPLDILNRTQGVTQTEVALPPF